VNFRDELMNDDQKVVKAKSNGLERLIKLNQVKYG
jgi:hypothetical protein